MTNEPTVYYLPSFSPERIKEYQILKSEKKLMRDFATIDDAVIELPGEGKPLTLKMTLEIPLNRVEKVSFSSKSDIEGIMSDLGVTKADDLDQKKVIAYFYEGMNQPEQLFRLVGISAISPVVPPKAE